MSQFHVRALYFFKAIHKEDLLSVRAWLIGKAEFYNVLGLIILGTEGLNTTLASRDSSLLDLFIGEVQKFFAIEKIDVKKSLSEKPPFRRFVVKIREEIVTIGNPEIIPNGLRRHLSPEEWHKMIEKEDVVVIDTRNDYEYELGTFEKAQDLKIKEFTEFTEKIKSFNSDKEKPHLIFCTGGIRCEKAIFAMEDLGYKNVYQLDGGILNYLEQFPEGKFEGECFVFDSRVAVDKHLQASKIYSLCPQCGEVGGLEIQCKKCDEPAKLCKKCLERSIEKPEYQTCSKNCRHHYLRDPFKKSPQQKQFYHQ